MTSLERAYAISNLLRRASDAKTDAERIDFEGQAIALMECSEVAEATKDDGIIIRDFVNWCDAHKSLTGIVSTDINDFLSTQNDKT